MGEQKKMLGLRTDVCKAVDEGIVEIKTILQKNGKIPAHLENHLLFGTAVHSCLADKAQRVCNIQALTVVQGKQLVKEGKTIIIANMKTSCTSGKTWLPYTPHFAKMLTYYIDHIRRYLVNGRHNRPPKKVVPSVDVDHLEKLFRNVTQAQCRIAVKGTKNRCFNFHEGVFNMQQDGSGAKQDRALFNHTWTPGFKFREIYRGWCMSEHNTSLFVGKDGSPFTFYFGAGFTDLIKDVTGLHITVTAYRMNVETGNEHESDEVRNWSAQAQDHTRDMANKFYIINHNAQILQTAGFWHGHHALDTQAVVEPCVIAVGDERDRDKDTETGEDRDKDTGRTRANQNMA